MPPSPLVSSVRQRLRAARRRLTGAAVAHGAAVTLGVIGAAAAAAIALEAAVWLGVGLRTAVFWLIAAALAALTVWGVVVPVLRGWGVLPGLDERAVVRRTGRDFAGVDDRLATFLDLADGRDAVADGPLRMAAVETLGREVAAVPFERVRAFGPARRAARWAVAPLVALVLLFVLWPTTMTAAAGRLLAPGVYFAPPAPFRLVVEPGDAEVTRGAALQISARAVGRALPLMASLEIGRADERATETVRLTAEAGAFAHAVEAVHADLRYRFEADGVRTPWHTVTAVDRPLVRGVRVSLVPPGYSGRPTRTLPEGVGDATGLVGTAVRVQVQHGGPTPTSAWLDVAWEDGRRQRVALRVGSEAALGQFRLRGAGTYTVHLKTAGGLENTDPATYRLGALSDGPPQIVLEDGADGPLGAGARRLTFRVTDDFGFRSGRLVYRLTRAGAQGPARAVRLGVRTRPLDQGVALDWRLPGARPGDVVELFGEVVDNGPNAARARTPIVTLRFPSLGDQLDDLDARRDSAAQTLEELDDEAEESRERFEQLRRELRENVQPDWEDRRQVEELLRRQDAMRERSESLREQVRRLSEQAEDAGMGDDLRRQFEEMQDVLEQLDSPDLRDALQRLQEAMENLDLQDMLEQAEEAALSEEELERRIERTMELMRRLEAAVEMEEIARRAEDLAETEEALAEQTERLDAEEAGEEADPSDDGTEAGDPKTAEQLAAEQREAAAQAEAMKEQLDALREQLEDIRNAPTEAVEQMQQEMSEDGGMSEQMEQNAEQLENGELQDAQEGQQDMAEQLRQMAGKMRESSQQMQGQQRQIDQAAIRRALEDVLTLSRDQEALATTTAALPGESPALVAAARRQSQLRDALVTVVDSLRRVAQTVPALGPRIDERAQNGRREMDLAIETLVARRAARAAGNQRTAMSHLNELALLLADVLDQLQSQAQQSGNGSGGGQGSGGAGGTSQQMQQLGRAQQQLNQRIQQMLNESAGERLSPDGERRQRQMGEQQEAIRRQLQRAVEGGGGDGLDERDRSALRRVEEQMREAARELRRGGLDQRAAPRQQNILEKLLEAERSVNQRGREEKREGETGRQRPAPPATAPRTTRPADRVRGDLIRALESGYAPDYQDLIKRYFERLQARTGG